MNRSVKFYKDHVCMISGETRIRIKEPIVDLKIWSSKDNDLVWRDNKTYNGLLLPEKISLPKNRKLSPFAKTGSLEITLFIDRDCGKEFIGINAKTSENEHFGFFVNEGCELFLYLKDIIEGHHFYDQEYQNEQ